MATESKAPPKRPSRPAGEPARSKRTQRERSEATTRRLVDTGRTLFARDGYAATSLDAIVAECGVTKGAFYHHFGGKRELFEAVFEREAQRTTEATRNAYATEDDPMEAAYAAAGAFFDASLDPGYQRITLLDAPSVLGWDRLRELEARHGLLLIKEGIRIAIAAGRIEKHDVDALAHLLYGALCEGAIYMARADDQHAVRRRVELEFKGILDALDTGRSSASP
jgi:AcrR family transcriptional regulator